MNVEEVKIQLEKAVQEFAPELFGLDPFTDYDSYEARLNEAEQDYNEACAAFAAADPNSETIMDAAELAENAAKELIRRTVVIYYTAQKPTQEMLKRALDILDRITKDANIRERTCCQFYHAVKEKYPEEKDYLRKLLVKKQKRMHFLDRCMRTQSYYQKKKIKEHDGSEEEAEKEKRLAAKVEHDRQYIPEGHMFMPARIFPHGEIPEGERVPNAPDAYQRVVLEDVENLVYDTEHDNFIIRPGYISEDGLIDDQSVVWDYDNNKVTIKYRGGVPVTWDFWKPKDTFDVLGPDHWCVRYMRRLWAQEMFEEIPGLFLRNHNDEEIPDYNRIPKK